jgi:plasmid stabilization system protein ParE
LENIRGHIARDNSEAAEQVRAALLDNADLQCKNEVGDATVEL